MKVKNTLTVAERVWIFLYFLGFLIIIAGIIHLYNSPLSWWIDMAFKTMYYSTSFCAWVLNISMAFITKTPLPFQQPTNDSVVDANVNFQALFALHKDDVSQIQDFATKFDQTLSIADSLGAPYDQDWVNDLQF